MAHVLIFFALHQHHSGDMVYPWLALTPRSKRIKLIALCARLSAVTSSILFHIWQHSWRISPSIFVAALSFFSVAMSFLGQSQSFQYTSTEELSASLECVNLGNDPDDALLLSFFSNLVH
jgi:hypothetical protein